METLAASRRDLGFGAHLIRQSVTTMTNLRIMRRDALSRTPAAQFARVFVLGLVVTFFAMAQVARASTWVVNSTGDPASGVISNCYYGGTCTLRDAVAAAASNDTIAFNVGSNATIKLVSNTTLTLANNVTIDGSGSAGLTIDGNNSVTVFTVNTGVTATFSHLTIANGNAQGGNGGGIDNSGTLTLTNVVVSGNSASQGGGIASTGALGLVASTVQGNHATSSGGGIYQSSSGATSMNISGSTISGNTSQADGGGIYTSTPTAAVIGNSTIYGNSAVTSGGGISNQYELTLVNDTFAGNTAGPNSGPDILNQFVLTSTNTIYADGCDFAPAGAFFGGNNLDAGTSCGFALADSNAQLNLGPLQDNGGPTLTVLPGPGSAAIDAGSDGTCSLAPVNDLDQRGVSRPQGAHCDIGAVEQKRICRVTPTGNSANDGSTWALPMDLQTAMNAINSSTAIACTEIWVAAGVYKPVVPVDMTNVTTAERSVSFDVRRGVAVYGGFAGNETTRDARHPAFHTTILSGDIDNNDTNTDNIDETYNDIQGSNSYHVVTMDGTTGAPVTDATVLDGFAITGGEANGSSPDDSGGGLYCDGQGSGSECSPSLTDIAFSGNLALGGGALYNNGTAGVSSPTLDKVTFSGNAALGGGALYNNGSTGGFSSPSLGNATFSGNLASYSGGAMFDEGSSGTSSPSLRNVTFSGNSAGDGGAMYDDGSSSGASSPSLSNVILWGDSATTNAEISNASATPTIDHSVVQGSGGSGNWQAGFGTDGGGNLDADPLLGPLQDNGGSTQTLMPGAGSPAIGAGLDSACNAAPVNALDQRGFARPIGTHCDIGAVEVADLSVYIDDGSIFGTYGSTIQYVVSVVNNSPTDTVDGIQVSGLGSAALNVPGTLYCRYESCVNGQISGPLEDIVNLAPGSLQMWLVNVPVFESSNDPSAAMTIHASGAGVTDTDTLVIFRDSFDGP